MRTLHEKFPDETFEKLKQVKDGRTWREAIVQEFGVEENDG